ncbi:tetratricopeptide repeat protein [Chryseobacterium sp. AG363]|uniref:tetratricopeptide repeat protein n=1 Tax=Chryseobacterium sp. AG363 TaxID=2183997 RepID=UPI000E737B00|nr:tetratricopeptide repeat protein [Chryseobacterium sp. AG363]
MKNIFYMFWVLMPCLIFGQYSISQIDSLYNTTHELRKKGKYQEAVDLNLSLIENARLKGYTKGAAYSSFEVGNLYHNMGNYKESLNYLDQALLYNKDIKIPELYSKVYAELGKNYSMLNLLQNAVDNYKTAEYWALKITDKSKKEKALFYIYSCEAVSYEALEDLNASVLAAEKAFNIKQDIISATRIAKNYMVYKKDLVNAKKFLDISNNLLKSDSSVTPYQKVIALSAIGLYYNKNKEYEKSAAIYLEAIDIAKKLKRPNEEKELYRLLYQTYKEGEKERDRLEALEKYAVINDSIESVNKTLIEIPMRKIVKEKQEKYNQNYRNLLFIGLLVVLIIASSAFMFIRQTKNHKKKLIIEKEKVILEKEVETQELKQKVNESFNDLLQLAKENSPQFWVRFQEVYPQFLNKMLAVNSKFTNAELVLSAYIYIGISTKDIASYTFRSLKTIENTRYSLRKKLHLPPDENLSFWLRSYVTKD